MPSWQASGDAMRTLVITPCSAEKHGDVPDPARAADLGDPERQRQAEARLAAFSCPAAEMYTGRHHRLVMDGLRAVWERWGRQVLEVAILSGGYGLLRAEDVIIPYDVSLDDFDSAGLADWIAHLRIPEQAATLLHDYDLAFYLLNGRYLDVLGLPLDVPASVHQIALTAQEDLALLPSVANLHALVAAEGAAARRWHVKAPHVRGFLFGRLCHQVAQHGPAVLEWLYQHPEDTEQLFYKRARWRPQLALW
jgi:hypothetical protein